MALPLLAVECKVFHSEPETRFDKYPETFSMLRVVPLLFNSMNGIGFREVNRSYFDSTFLGHFTFKIENKFLLNGIELVYLVASILFLIRRDRQETEMAEQDPTSNSSKLKGDEEESSESHNEETLTLKP